jgi:Recombinase zinc beta ribbon domain
VQLRANRADHLGPVRSGTALLSGLVVCGRCGLRMTAAYNNDGHAAGYICDGQHPSYGAPFCQSLKSAQVDVQVTSIVLHALEPAALEASLAVAADLQAERTALEQRWRQRLERAQYKVDQARRRYASTEPENRLVARTLERNWEESLAEQARLTADHERFRCEPHVRLFQRLRRRNLGQPRPQAPGPAELAAIRQLTLDLPALWQASTTSSEERLTIVRLLLERVLLTVVDASERVRLECHWHCGCRTTHTLIRPVARAKALSTYAALLARAVDLHRVGNGYADIAAILNQEARRPPKRRDTFNAPMVRRLLTTAGVIEPGLRRPRTIPLPRLTALLHSLGVSVSECEIQRLLIERQGGFLDENRDVLRMGLETSAWVSVDDTGARHKAKNGFSGVSLALAMANRNAWSARRSATTASPGSARGLRRPDGTFLICCVLDIPTTC